MQALGIKWLNNRVFPEACVSLSPGEGSFLSSKDGDNAHKALNAESQTPHLVFISFWNNHNPESTWFIIAAERKAGPGGCGWVVEHLPGLHANLGFYRFASCLVHRELVLRCNKAKKA